MRHGAVLVRAVRQMSLHVVRAPHRLSSGEFGCAQAYIQVNRQGFTLVVRVARVHTVTYKKAICAWGDPRVVVTRARKDLCVARH